MVNCLLFHMTLYSMNILLLQHFEPYWEDGLSKLGTDFQTELNKVLDFVNNTDLDLVIITQFESFELNDEHAPLIELCQRKGIQIQQKTYGYAFMRDEDAIDRYPLGELDKTWCYGTRDHHGEEDVLEIEDWHHNLKGHTVYLGGAFEGECLLDKETVLSAIAVDFIKVDGLSVGHWSKYEFIGLEPEELQGNIYSLLETDDLEDFVNEHRDEIIMYGL